MSSEETRKSETAEAETATPEAASQGATSSPADDQPGEGAPSSSGAAETEKAASSPPAEGAAPPSGDTDAAGQPDAGQADAGQPDAGQADAGQADAGQADARQADAGQADAGQPDAGQADEPATPATPTIGGAIAALVDKLSSESAQHYDRLLRTAADFENFKRRAKRDINDARIRAEDKTVVSFLPVMDNLERALEHAERSQEAAGDEEAATAANSLLEGVRMVHKQFLDTLGRFGISLIEAVGQPFDPELHEALQQAPSTEHPKGHVVHELQHGYKREGKLVRASMVIVSAGPPAPPAAEASGDDSAEDAAEAESAQAASVAESADSPAAEAPAADAGAAEDKPAEKNPPDGDSNGGGES